MQSDADAQAAKEARKLVRAAKHARACVDASAAVRMHVRCNEVARIALALVTTSKSICRQYQRCRMIEEITERVYSGYCRRVQVMQRDWCAWALRNMKWVFFD
jgi:hypothetical protein